MIIGYTGTHRGMTRRQHEDIIAHFARLTPISELHHGDCVGGDLQFHELVGEYLTDVTIVVHPPEDSKMRAWCNARDYWAASRGIRVKVLDPAPYLVRDRDIVDASDVIFAAPESIVHSLCRHGTCYTARYAAREGVPVLEILKEGFRHESN